MTSRPRNEALNISQLPLHPSMQMVHIPDIGTTLRERFAVLVASLAFGRRKFIDNTSNKRIVHKNIWVAQNDENPVFPEEKKFLSLY
jgi:hypothetical protein